MDFAAPADNGEKLKESEKNDKYVDPAREVKKCRTWKLHLYQL